MVVPTVEVAAEEIKEQEKQRVLGVIPNFYVSYVQDAAPLTSKQKFGLAWKTTIDPVNFAVVGVIAGVQQWQDNFKDYGEGAQGYGKRYGASYADFVTSTFFGGAVLPSLLKQDPRYFYKGTGTVRDGVWYAVSMAVMCKGDNGRWQFNYSAIGGSLISGGISNAYYPDKDRGADLVFENTLIGIGENAATNLLQEFVIRKLTPAAKNNNRNGGPALVFFLFYSNGNIPRYETGCAAPPVLRLAFALFPALTGRANLCRTSGAGCAERRKRGRKGLGGNRREILRREKRSSG